MRTAVVLALISELRDSGYPGYRGKFNTDAAVRQRAEDLYGQYGEEPFVPAKVREAAEQAFRAKLSGPSLLFDGHSRGATLPDAGVAGWNASIIFGWPS